MVTMFIDTLPSPFCDKAVGSVASSFADLVMSGIKRGKFVQSSSNVGLAKKPSQEKKKGEANAILLESTLPYGQGATYSPHKLAATSIHSILAEMSSSIPASNLAEDQYQNYSQL
ncbi:hypothetical protein CR513_30525, partial [Mucuna pruriens]